MKKLLTEKRSVGRPTKYRPEMCSTVVKLMSDGKSVTQVAASLGVARNKIYKWAKDEDKPEFKEAFQLGQTMSEAWWEDFGRRGTMGELPNFKPVSWIYTMKCRFRDRWMDRTESKIEFSDAAKDLSNKELEEKLKVLLSNEKMPSKKII